MAGAPYILARTMKEAHSFARDVLGLTYGHYRIVNTPATLKSVRGVELHLVPGWQNRFDRFTMKAAMRWTRMEVIEHNEDEVLEEPDDLEPAGTQLALAPEPEPVVEQQPEEPKGPEVKRRRRRCKECGVLVDPDEVESHAQSHLPVEA